MRTSVRTSTRPRSYLSITPDNDDDLGLVVELSFPAVEYEDVLTELVGDKLVVAYLSHDDSPSNPMEEGCANGELITRGFHDVITDNLSRMLSELELHDENDPDIDHDFVLNGDRVTLRGLAARIYEARMRADPSMIVDHLAHEGVLRGDEEVRWFHLKNEGLVSDEEWQVLFAEHHEEAFKWLEDPNSPYSEEIEEIAHGLYAAHWQDVVGPFVVPAYYHAERGSVHCRATTWDGDPDDLPDGIWVADKDARENIEASALPAGAEIAWEHCGTLGSGPDKASAVLRWRGEFVAPFADWGAAVAAAREKFGEPTPADLHRAAVAYADAILTEYASWAEGDVYGCIVEIFEATGLDGEWKQSKEDSCWGFIGHDHAQESLKTEFFQPAVDNLKKELEAPSAQ